MLAEEDSSVSPPMGFLHDLKRGEAGEDFVITKLQEIHSGTVTKSSGAKGWDFSISKNGKEELYEIKSDFRAKQTRNLFLEIECSGKPSGLTSTTAAIWVYYIPDECLILFCPKKMLQWIRENGKPIGGGDGGRAKGFLAKVNVVDGLDFVKKISL